jgi:hypothetical protein
MSKFNLMHCIPHPRMHGLNGYREVIESVQWGLEQLGYEVRYSLNKFRKSSTNIIFGAQVLPIDFLKQLPGETIVYNFEQNRGLEKHEIRQEMQFIAKHLQIWEYSPSNLESWKLLGADNPKLVPVGYAPVLTRIPKFNPQDIDVLIYGMSGDKRLNAFHRLSHAGLNIVFASGFYGQLRDSLIARSKIILNVNLYDHAQIFEVVRVSYLLANKKAVIATMDENTAVEKDLCESIKFTSMDKLVEDCMELLQNENKRIELEKTGYENIIKRDIVKILQGALNYAP